MFLLDTNVISAGAPAKRGHHERLLEWFESNAERLFLSVATIAEIENGIAKSSREGATRKAADLQAWLGSLLYLYEARILVMDVETARTTGRMSDVARSLGRSPGLVDMIIAATAATHRLTLLTRNVKDFEGLGLAIVDPFNQLLN